MVATAVSLATAVCDQVVTVQHVDDIDEVHQLDPVHQVDHKDELWGGPAANLCCFFNSFLKHAFSRTGFSNIFVWDVSLM